MHDHRSHLARPVNQIQYFSTSKPLVALSVPVSSSFRGTHFLLPLKQGLKLGVGEQAMQLGSPKEKNAIGKMIQKVSL